jgi:hypothetical protein
MNTSSVIKTIFLTLLPLASAIIYAESSLHEQKAHIHGVSEINVTWITDTKQGMSVLNPNSNQLFVE